MVTNDRSAYARSPLVEPVIVAQNRITRSVPALKRVQSRPIGFEHSAAMEVVRAVFRDHQDLRAAVPAIVRTVRVRLNSDLLYRFLVRRNHSGATPSQAVHLDAVNLEAVRAIPGAICHDLN